MSDYRRGDVIKAKAIEEYKLKNLTERLIYAYGRNEFMLKLEDGHMGHAHGTDKDAIKDLESAVRVSRANVFAYSQLLNEMRDE